MFIFETTDAGCDIDTFWCPAKEEVFQSEYPLHHACRDGNIEQVVRIITHQASNLASYEGAIPRIVFVEDHFYGWTPAHWAAYFGKLDCLRRVTQTSRHVDVPNSNFMQTPAHITAFAGHPHCLQWLLDIGADPSRRDYLGETPLHKAARSGSVECITLLLSRGARANITSSSGQLAAQVAEHAGHYGAAAILQEQSRKSQNATACKPLIQNGAYSNGYYGYQPAAAQSHCDMVVEDVLLSPEVSCNRKPIGGRKRSREVFEVTNSLEKRFKSEPFQDKTLVKATDTHHSKCMVSYFL